MPPTKPMSIAGRISTKPAPGVMATRPASAPEMAPRLVGLPVRTHSTSIQPSTPQAGGHVRGDQGVGGQGARNQGAAGVKAEPAEPEQAAAQQGQGQVVGVAGSAPLESRGPKGLGAARQPRGKPCAPPRRRQSPGRPSGPSSRRPRPSGPWERKRK